MLYIHIACDMVENKVQSDDIIHAFVMVMSWFTMFSTITIYETEADP